MAGGTGGCGRDLNLWIGCEVNHATRRLVGTSVCTVTIYSFNFRNKSVPRWRQMRKLGLSYFNIFAPI